MKTEYPSNLSDQQWEIIAPLIPPPKTGGRPRTTDMREICNAIYYHLKTGCQWEYLPKDFPPHSTVYNYYRKWQKKGVWEEINQKLRELVREKEGKEKQSTIAIADSQSVKTTEKRGMCTVLMEEKRLKDEKGNYWLIA
jgi:putative transposase